MNDSNLSIKHVSLNYCDDKTYPCRHSVLFTNGIRKELSSCKIVELLKKENLDVPEHFQNIKVERYSVKISPSCDTCYPCFHEVEFDCGRKEKLSASCIVDILKNSGEEIPTHFLYADDTNNDFLISEECLESCPCDHVVYHNGRKELMSETDIKEHLRNAGKPIPPHFECSSECGFSLFD